MRNAKIHNEINNAGERIIDIEGGGKEILYLLSSLICDISEKAGMTTNEMLVCINKGIEMYKISKKQAENEA